MDGTNSFKKTTSRMSTSGAGEEVFHKGHLLPCLVNQCLVFKRNSTFHPTCLQMCRKIALKITVKSNFMFTRANTPFSVKVIVVGCCTPVQVRGASSGTEICLLSLVCEWKHAAFTVLCSLLTCSILVSMHYEKMQQKYKIEVLFTGTNI